MTNRRRSRGSSLLLDHCARLGRVTGSHGASARERLEARIGSELTRVLLGSLCERGDRPSRAW